MLVRTLALPLAVWSAFCDTTGQCGLSLLQLKAEPDEEESEVCAAQLKGSETYCAAVLKVCAGQETWIR